MTPYSKDLRQRIITARASGISADEISQRYDISKRTVERYWKRYQESGSFSSLKRGRPKGSILDPHKEIIFQWIKEEPGLTLEQLCERISKELNTKISIPSLWTRLKAYNLRYKKNDMRKGTTAS